MQWTEMANTLQLESVGLESRCYELLLTTSEIGDRQLLAGTVGLKS